MPTAPIRILIADDHALLRAPLHALLDAQPDLEVVGESANGREAVESASQLQPDIILMDLNMPNLNGTEAARIIHRDVPRAKVIVLSSYGDEELVLEALRAGVHGYVIKRSDMEELILAIKTVQRGNTYFSAALAESIDVADLQFRARRQDPAAARDALTPREREIVQLIAEGNSSRAIGEMLCISQKTVESHKSRIMLKLGARSRTDLLRFAIRSGIIGLEAAREAHDGGDDWGPDDANAWMHRRAK